MLTYSRVRSEGTAFEPNTNIETLESPARLPLVFIWGSGNCGQGCGQGYGQGYGQGGRSDSPVRNTRVVRLNKLR